MSPARSLRLAFHIALLGAPLHAQSAGPLEPVLPAGSDTLLYDYLLRLADEQFDRREAALDVALTSAETTRARYDRLREEYLRLLGPMPERTPLNARVTGMRRGSGYRIEHVVFESRPAHHVTGNLYVPETGEGPWPAVLLTCGHSDVGKAAETYQRAALALVTHGFVVFVVDPIGQGERYQFLDEDGRPATAGGTLEHSLLYVGAVLTGTSIVAHEAWDNIRAIDYLVGRSEVNPTRIGVTGNSGGGTQTTFLIPLDDRIDVGAPSCFIMTRRRLFRTIGPQDGCQHVPGEGKIGIDHADYLAMFAPRPTLMLAAEQDFFEFAATRDAHSELNRIYGTLEIPERHGLFSFDDTHGFSGPRRVAVTEWMQRWLRDESVAVAEPSVEVQTEEDLRVVPEGQVGAHFENEVFVQDIHLERAAQLAGRRAAFRATSTASAFLGRVSELIGLSSRSTVPTLVRVRSRRRAGVEVRDMVVERPGEVPIPLRLYLPEGGSAPAGLTLLIDHRGKDAESGPQGLIGQELEQGRAVAAVDLRGFGETADDPARNTYIGGSQAEYRTAMVALHVGRTLLGMRVEDAMAALGALSAVDGVQTSNVRVVAIGRAGPVGMHLAALDERVSQLAVHESITSYIDVLERPTVYHQLGHAVPAALEWYDLPDLVDVTRARGVAVALE